MARLEDYDFPVFGTQGGGLVRETAPGNFVFVEAPDPCLNLKAGDKMPSEWSVAPANQWARDLMEEDLYGKPMPMSQIFKIIAEAPDFE